MNAIPPAAPLTLEERAAWAMLEADTSAAYALAARLLASAAPSALFNDLAGADAPDINPAACRALVEAGAPDPYEIAKATLAARWRRHKAAMRGQQKGRRP